MMVDAIGLGGMTALQDTTVLRQTQANSENTEAAGAQETGAAGGAQATGGASQASTTTAASAAYDPADLNQDGIVTPQEELLYALSHGLDPNASDQIAGIGNQTTGYAADGTATAGATRNLLNITA